MIESNQLNNSHRDYLSIIILIVILTSIFFYFWILSLDILHTIFPNWISFGFKQNKRFDGSEFDVSDLDLESSSMNVENSYNNSHKAKENIELEMQLELANQILQKQKQEILMLKKSANYNSAVKDAFTKPRKISTKKVKKEINGDVFEEYNNPMISK